MSDCWRKANPGLSWGKPCPQCGTYVRVYGDGANVSSGVDGDTHAITDRDASGRRTRQLPRGGEKQARRVACAIPDGGSRFDSGLLTPIPPHGFAAPEAVTPRAWAVSDTDDFGPLSALPLVIPASLVLWAVIAAAWIALK